MAITVFREQRESRPFNVGAGVATATLKYMALRSDNEGEVLQAIRDNAPLLFSGLYRMSAKATPEGGGVWSCEVEYGLPTDGSSRSELPTPATDPGGGPEPPAQPEPDQYAPIGPEFSFSTTGGTRKITQSLATISSTAVAPNVAPDFKGAINATSEGVEGCEVTTQAFEWSVTRQFAECTLAYKNRLAQMTGTTNNDTFYGYARGELLFLGAEGQCKTGGAWSVTFKFAARKNRTDVPCGGGIFAPLVRGWHYLWVAYKKDTSNGRTINVPLAAYVEQVYEEKLFTLLGI